MRLLITVWGETYKLSAKGEPYGWPVAEYCTVERKFGDEVLDEALKLDVGFAIKKGRRAN